MALVNLPFQAAELREKAFWPLPRPDRQNPQTLILEVILNGLWELGCNGHSSNRSLDGGRGSSC
eukprot:2865301-Rhodomonas_salina.1